MGLQDIVHQLEVWLTHLLSGSRWLYQSLTFASSNKKVIIFLILGKYGINKPIVASAVVNLKSPVFQEFVAKRAAWE